MPNLSATSKWLFAINLATISVQHSFIHPPIHSFPQQVIVVVIHLGFIPEGHCWAIIPENEIESIEGARPA